MVIRTFVLIRVVFVVPLELWIVLVFIVPKNCRVLDDEIQELRVLENCMVGCRDPFLVPQRVKQFSIRERKSVDVLSASVVRVQLNARIG